MTMTTTLNPTFPTTIGDPSLFSVRVDLDEHYNGEWLFGKIAYVIGNTVVGDYDLGTSLRDVLLQMNLILSDANQRRTTRFEGQPKEKNFEVVWPTLFGDSRTGWEQIANEECWAKHDITIHVDVFDKVRVFQFDEEDYSRIIWQATSDSNDCQIHELRVPLGLVESVFRKLFDLLNKLLEKEESMRAN